MTKSIVCSLGSSQGNGPLLENSLQTNVTTKENLVKYSEMYSDAEKDPNTMKMRFT